MKKSKHCSHKRNVFMHPTHDTSAFTTVSGMVGGVVKAISAKPRLMTISLNFSNVMFYAAVSATVGYFVKLGLDRLAAKFKSKDNNQNFQK
ncbi:MAG: hypothetical protein R2809_00145 [Flavobacteriales bacterium]